MLSGVASKHYDARRSVINVHPVVQAKLGVLLMRPQMRGTGYSEFIERAIDATHAEINGNVYWGRSATDKARDCANSHNEATGGDLSPSNSSPDAQDRVEEEKPSESLSERERQLLLDALEGYAAVIGPLKLSEAIEARFLRQKLSVAHIPNIRNNRG